MELHKGLVTAVSTAVSKALDLGRADHIIPLGMY